MIRRIIASSRYLIIIAVLGAFLAAAATLIYGGITVLYVIGDAFVHHDFTPVGVKHFAVDAIGLIDLFLVGTVLYIVALGLYDLFIDDHLPMPQWLHIRTLDELKEKLIGVIVVLLAVTFLGEVVEWKGGDTSILSLGIAIALVIAALSLLLIFNTHGSQASSDHAPPEA